VSAWLKRFALHLAAAVGATGVFVAAAAVGANQTRQQVADVTEPIPPIVRTHTPTAQRKPTVVVTPTPAAIAPADATQPQPTSQPASEGLAATTPTAVPTQLQPTPRSKPQAAATPTQPPPPQSQPTQPPPPQTPPTQPQTQTQTQTRPAPHATTTPDKVLPERSLAGSIKAVRADEIDVLGVGGHEWHVAPVPGALIRLNGKAAKLDALQVGDNVVILGQAQPGPGARFLAHAITAKSK
jgi:hypothetical protein